MIIIINKLDQQDKLKITDYNNNIFRMKYNICPTHQNFKIENDKYYKTYKITYLGFKILG